MPKFIITETQSYEVEAKDEMEAMMLYRISFDQIEPSIFGLTQDVFDNMPEFEHLDGKTEVEIA